MLWRAVILLVLMGRVLGQSQVQAIGNASGPAAGAQRNVELGYSPMGNRYLAVWDDKRPSAFGQENIRGRFLGSGLDIPICEAAGEQKRPALAPLEDGFMVFWEDRRNTSLPKGPRDIFAAKISSAGIVLPLGGRQISWDAADESDVEAASNAKGTIAVWEQAGREPGLFASRTGPTGVLLDSSPFPVGMKPGFEPDVAANADGFLIVWENFDAGRRIMGCFVESTQSGTAQAGPAFEVGPFLDGEAEPEIMTMGDLFLVCWSYNGTDGEKATIVGRRMRPDGTSPDPLAVTLASGVRAKDRAMVEYEGCTYLITIPAKSGTSIPFPIVPEVPVLQARRICYKGVIDVGSPWNVSQPGIDFPQDPSVVRGQGASAYISWEDVRNNGTDADEDIYVRVFLSNLYPGQAQLVSTASEPPQVKGNPVQGGDMVAWNHAGGELAAGLAVYSHAGRSWWWPATAAPVPAATDGRRRVEAFTTVPLGIGLNGMLWRGREGTLEAGRITYDYFESQEKVVIGNAPRWVLCLSSVPESRVLSGGQLVNYRPASAAVLSDNGLGGVNCSSLVLTSQGDFQALPLGSIARPAYSSWPTVWGIKMVGSGSRIGIAVWLEDPAFGGGPAGRLWLRTGLIQDGVFRMTTEWLDEGNTHGGLGVEVAADDRGMVWVSRVQSTGPDQGAWEARRLDWDGSRSGPFTVGSQYSSEWSMVPRPGGGFIGFQGAFGGVGGGEIQVTELGPDLVPERAWRWEIVPMGVSHSLQPEGDSVRIVAATWTNGEQLWPGLVQALWRPFKAMDGEWNPVSRFYLFRCAGPAGMAVGVYSGASPAALEFLSGGQLSSPGWRGDQEGKWEAQFPAGNATSRFFRAQAAWLRQVNP